MGNHHNKKKYRCLNLACKDPKNIKFAWGFMGKGGACCISFFFMFSTASLCASILTHPWSATITKQKKRKKENCHPGERKSDI